MSRFIDQRWPSFSSSPMMKSRRTTPSSATVAIVSGSPTSANPDGPMTTPAARYPSTALRPSSRNSGTATTAAPQNVRIGGRKLTWEAVSAIIFSQEEN